MRRYRVDRTEKLRIRRVVRSVFFCDYWIRHNHLHSQLRDFNAPVTLRQPVAILPKGIPKLRGPDDDFLESDARSGLERFDADVNSSIEAEDQPGEVAIQHQVASCKQYFAGRGDGCARRRHFVSSSESAGGHALPPSTAGVSCSLRLLPRREPRRAWTSFDSPEDILKSGPGRADDL